MDKLATFVTITTAGMVIWLRRKIYAIWQTKPQYGDVGSTAECIGAGQPVNPDSDSPWRCCVGYTMRRHTGMLACMECGLSMNEVQIIRYRKDFGLPDDLLPPHPYVNKQGDFTPTPPPEGAAG